MQQQHVIDWWKYRGYRVTVLSDWSLMCVSEMVDATTDQQRVADAIQRNHDAMWRKRTLSR